MLVPFKDIPVGRHFSLIEGSSRVVAFKGRVEGATVHGSYRELSPLKEVDSSLPRPVGMPWPKYHLLTPR